MRNILRTVVSTVIKPTFPSANNHSNVKPPAGNIVTFNGTTIQYNGQDITYSGEV